MSNKQIVLKKMNLLNTITTCSVAFHTIDSERDRIARWFWWASNCITPNSIKFTKFMLLCLLNSGHKKLLYRLKRRNSYNEYFWIFVDKSFCGMIGLDDINKKTKDAEVWCFISQSNEGCGIATESVRYIENYLLDNKNTERVYARIEDKNTRSIDCFCKNGYKPETLSGKYGARIFSKQLQR